MHYFNEFVIITVTVQFAVEHSLQEAVELPNLPFIVLSEEFNINFVLTAVTSTLWSRLGSSNAS